MIVEDAHRVILRRLYMGGYIGGRHTAIDHLKKGVPSHLQRSVDRAIRDLIKEGYIVKKPTGYGTQVSLNVNMIPEIERILGM